MIVGGRAADKNEFPWLVLLADAEPWADRSQFA